jgi:hypothetical protein
LLGGTNSTIPAIAVAKNDQQSANHVIRRNNNGPFGDVEQADAPQR